MVGLTDGERAEIVAGLRAALEDIHGRRKRDSEEVASGDYNIRNRTLPVKLAEARYDAMIRDLARDLGQAIADDLITEAILSPKRKRIRSTRKSY